MTAVTKIPQTYANDASIGTVAWTNPGNAIASDNVYATSVLPTNGNSTQRLKATGCGFAIPIGARIDGIAVTVEMNATAGSVDDFFGPTLYRAGVVDNQAIYLNSWPVADTVFTYGGPTDLWSGGWTPADINDSGFGVAIRSRITAGAPGTARVDAITITVYYTLGSVVTTVHFYEPDSGAEILMIEPSACLSHFRIKGMGTASFLLPRSDPKVADVARLLARCVPLVAILRSDGNLPFVGYPVSPSFEDTDTHGAFQLADHTLMLNQGNARIAAEVKLASGYLIADELRAAALRAEPPLNIDLSLVGGGPPASIAMSGQNLDSFLREMERQTDYEAFLSYNVTPATPYPTSLKTFLNWRNRQGTDRRNEDRWEGGIHLSKVKYAYDYTKGLHAHTSVGGTGVLTDREAQTASVNGRSIGKPNVVAPGSLLGIGGSKVEFNQMVTDPPILAMRSEQYIGSPENAVIRWEADVIESGVDMSRVECGDIRVLSSDTAYLGQPVTGVARMIGLELNADSGVHRAIFVEAV